MNDRRIRVLIGKPGLDGHDRGAKTVASVLRDHGMEVVYTGLHQTPAMIAEAAAQEDVDVVGLSLLSGAHMQLFPRVRDELTARGKGDVLLVGGGSDRIRGGLGARLRFGCSRGLGRLVLTARSE